MMGPAMYIGGNGGGESPSVNVTSIDNGWIVRFTRPRQRDETAEMVSMVAPTIAMGEMVASVSAKSMDSELEPWKDKPNEKEKAKALKESIANTVNQIKAATEDLKGNEVPREVTMVFERGSYEVMMEAIGQFLQSK